MQFKEKYALLATKINVVNSEKLNNQVLQTLRCYVRVPHIMIRGVINIITSTIAFAEQRHTYIVIYFHSPTLLPTAILRRHKRADEHYAKVLAQNKVMEYSEAYECNLKKNMRCWLQKLT